MQTPKNCYHCARSDYKGYGKEKRLVCKWDSNKRVRTNQKACHEYRPMAKSAEICRCTQCQKLLEKRQAVQPRLL